MLIFPRIFEGSKVYRLSLSTKPAVCLQGRNDKPQRMRGILSLRLDGEWEARDLICDFTNILTGDCLHILSPPHVQADRREERPLWMLSLKIIAEWWWEMQNLCRKKRQFVPGYYFANDFNDAVNRIGYIFMIYILYHRLICFSS